MHFYYFFLLLLVVLSAYSESPHHAKPPDSDTTIVTVCPNSIFAQLGILAPVLPQNEVYKTTPPQNEVFRSHIEMNITVLSQNQIVNVNCQLVDKMKNSVLNFGVKSFRFLISTLMYDAEKFAWSIRILLESLQHVLQMYTWSLSENQVSVRFRCRLIGLLLKQSLFRKHDFAILIHRVYDDYQTFCVWHLNIFSSYGSHSNRSRVHIRAEPSEKSTRFHVCGGGKALIFSFDELFPYVSTDLHEQQYQFLQCVKENDKQNMIFNDSDLLCNVPLNVLAPKLTLKAAKALANLHDMYMPSKIQLKNAQILLENHKCETCPDLLAVFQPYKVAFNAKYQQTWYQKNKEKRAEYDKQRTSNFKYQESHKKSSQKHYWSKKDIEFPPAPPSAKLCQNIVSDFCVDTSPDVFEEAGCSVCGKLTPICEMEELSEVENINLLKVDGVTRKARCKTSDPVRELKGPILAPGCSRVCPICAESLDKKKMPTLALANGLWVGEIPDELKDLTYAEQLLIARVRHNRCIVKVSSGMFKMQANAISFSNPMPKIYDILPPPIEEMDEVLAFIYTGPCKPTKADFQRTPLLVRHLKVSKALHWLKLNHVDYYDCEISEKNLASYPEDGPPVVVDYHSSSSNKNPESTSGHDIEEEDGTTEGPCPFIVHGLTGEEFSTKTIKTIKAIAL